KSPVQLKAFCKSRRVPVSSLDKYHAPVVLQRAQDELATATAAGDEKRVRELSEVITMLEIKLEIGGSSLSKLPKILDTISEDGRLRDQYIHLGAGQTFRSTGRSVMMQNITRLKGDTRDLATLQDYSVEWTNTEMS